MRRWSVMIGCGIGLSVSVGTYFWLSFGLFLAPVTTEFGWSRLQFSAIYSAASIVNAIVLPIAGYFVDRFGPKRIILAGMILCACSYAAFGLAHSYWAFIVIGCLVAGTGCIASYPSYLSLIPRWFDRHLGLALSLSASGIGLGAAIFPHIINASMAAAGWRNAFFYTAAFALVIGLVNFAVLVRDNKGPMPEAERMTAAQVVASGADVPFGQGVRSVDFWLFSIAFSLVFLVTMGVNFHLGGLLSDQGGSPAQAASAVAALGTASLVARLGTGFLLDRFPIRVVAGVFFIGQAVGCLLLAYEGTTFVILAAALLGLAQGAELDMLPFVIARRFGQVAYAQLYGSAYAVLAVGQIISPLVLGWVYGWTGSYHVGLVMFPVLSMVSLAMVSMARVQRPVALASERLAEAR